MNTKDLKPDPNNPNVMTARQLSSLKYSMEKFDDIHPIVVDSKTMIIADGHHRWRVYLDQGIEKIQVIKKDFKNAAERVLFGQTMNKLRGEHDKKIDVDVVYSLVHDNTENLNEYMALMAIEDEASVLSYIQKQHPDYSLAYNEEKDLDNLSEIEKVVTKDSDMVTEVDPITKTGDLIKLGDHLLLCGDASNVRDMNMLLDGERAQLILTDPPYGIDAVNEYGRVGVSIKVKAGTYRKITNDDRPFNPDHLFKLSNHLIIFGGNYFAEKLPISSGWLVWYKRHEDWERNSFSECELIWTSHQIPARVYPVTWLGLIKEGENGRRLHPIQKPVKLLMNLLSDFSKSGDLILDPYLGSGSTLMACEQTGRKCLGMEIEPYYCDIIVERWEKYTGKKAERLSKE